MPFKQVLGDVKNALGKMSEWTGMGYDVNTYDEFFFLFHPKGQETGDCYGHDGSREEVAGQPKEAIPVVITRLGGGFVMRERCYASCSPDCTER